MVRGLGDAVEAPMGHKQGAVGVREHIVLRLPLRHAEGRSRELGEHRSRVCVLKECVGVVWVEWTWRVSNQSERRENDGPR